jgi:transcriptional regulator with XRE-family HTH domain
MPTPTTATNADVGAMFRAARTAAGVGVRTLADRAEVSHTTISRWERGERDIAASTYEHLTLALADLIAAGGAP